MFLTTLQTGSRYTGKERDAESGLDNFGGHIAADEVPMLCNGKFCPSCHTESLHHSHRPLRDWFLGILRLRSVRCICYYQRFLVSRASYRSAYRADIRRTRLN